ncbi:MAG: hypothetical protein JWL64_872 [Frankiales bacterium]|nr:hypothetical protein [Frankiales bacterium]
MYAYGPDGREWQVRRRWMHRDLPKLRRLRQPEDDGPDLDWLADFLDDPVTALLALAGLVVVGVLAVLFVLPALIFVFELLFVLIVVGLGVLTRVLFRRPWTVEARRQGTVVRQQAVGWRRSSAALAELAAAVSAGRLT